MQTKRTPLEWFEAAMSARDVAARMTEDDAKAAWAQLADECDASGRAALDNRH